jgi:ABC-type glycerol-3-phosphate transport system substrate-binding protein
MDMGNAVLTNLWFRKELLAEEGLKPPVYMEDWLEVARKTTKNGMYGVSLPFASAVWPTHWSTTPLACGGMVISPDMQVVFNPPATI